MDTNQEIGDLLIEMTERQAALLSPLPDGHIGFESELTDEDIQELIESVTNRDG